MARTPSRRSPGKRALRAMTAMLVLASASIARQRPDPARLASVDLTGLAPATVNAMGLDLASSDGCVVPAGPWHVIAHDRELALFDRMQLAHEVLIEDLVAFYQSRFTPPPEAVPAYGAWLNPPFGAGSMGGYYTFDEVVSVLDQMRAAYPDIVTEKQSLGQTVEGRDLWMVRITDLPDQPELEPEIRFDAMHHAREPEGMQATLWFMLYLLEEYGEEGAATHLVNQRDMWFVPIVNPDGYVYNEEQEPEGGGLWRKNRRDNGDGTFGVDLNRNYPAFWGVDDEGSSPDTSSQIYRGTGPASEPEIAAMRDFIESRLFAVSVSTHTYKNLWMYPYGFALAVPLNDEQYAELAEMITGVNGYTFGPVSFELYVANGITVDFDQENAFTLAWTPEIGTDEDGFWPATERIVPLAEENRIAFQRAALIAGPWVAPKFDWLADAGDGDGFSEPGERIELPLVVKNFGLEPGTTAVVVELSTPSPFATVVAGSLTFPPLDSGEATDPGATAPLALEIAAAASDGTRIDYTLTIEAEGFRQDFPRSLRVTEPPFERAHPR